MEKIDMNDHPRLPDRAQKMQRGQKNLKKSRQSSEPLKPGHRLPDFAASLNTNSTVNDAPPTIDLSAIEWERVEASYEKGINQEDQLSDQAKNVPAVVRDIRRFLKLWKTLSPAAQGCLVEDNESIGMYQNESIIRFRIEDRANEALLFLTTPRGRPKAIAHQQAVEILARIWTAHGGKVIPGRLYGDKKSGPVSGSDYTPNAFIKFVSGALRRLDPDLKTDSMAARRAKSAVDALRTMGRL